MDDDQVRRTIEELERALAEETISGVEKGLAQDDPALMKRFRAMHRAELATVVSVLLLMCTGTVLLTVGLATVSWPAWITGVAAFVASFIVDEHHKHTLRRMDSG